MSESFQTIPHFYLSVDVNAAALVAYRQKVLSEYEQTYGIHLTYTDILLKALAVTLKDHPLLNASYHSEGEIKIYEAINLGVAISDGQGLVVGVIHDSDRLSLVQIAQTRLALTQKARDHKLAPQDILGGTFTLTNLGMYGIDNFSPIINPDQSAILAVGAIAERPTGENGQVVLRPMMKATLAVDHRVADGVSGALFFRDFVKVLESPEALGN